MTYEISYADGRKTVETDTYDQALDLIRSEYGDDAVTEHDGDLSERGPRTLCWEDEASAANDDGQHSVAEITVVE